MSTDHRRRKNTYVLRITLTVFVEGPPLEGFQPILIKIHFDMFVIVNVHLVYTVRKRQQTDYRLDLASPLSGYSGIFQISAALPVFFFDWLMKSRVCVLLLLRRSHIKSSFAPSSDAMFVLRYRQNV